MKKYLFDFGKIDIAVHVSCARPGINLPATRLSKISNSLSQTHLHIFALRGFRLRSNSEILPLKKGRLPRRAGSQFPS